MTVSLGNEVISAPRFWVQCSEWTAGLGFTELGGVKSQVEKQDYWYSGRLGNTLNRQFGRAVPCTLTLKRALDEQGFLQLFAWHTMARLNNPLAKVPTVFTIMSVNGKAFISCMLENAWCSDLEIEKASAGMNVLMLTATIQCDSITPAA
jgi:hypothetical protein